MKYVLVSVYDTAAQLYQAPMCVPHVAVATRWFADQLNDPQSPMFRHRQDFELREVGMFDMATGEPSGVLQDGESVPPQRVCRGADFQVRENGHDVP